MADKTLREFAAPSADNVAIGPQINMGDVDFDLKSSLIMMAKASPFCGKPNKDANAHLQQFLEICSTYTIKGVTPDAVRLRLFSFSLLGRAKQWFYANRAAVNTWDKCSTAFLLKFFPIGKTNALRGRISSFQQTRDEFIPKAWERLQEVQQFDQALCDLGASVSVMLKDVFDKLNFTVLAPTPMRLQLADSSVRYPAGIVEDVPVKIRDFFILVDFVVLDMDTGKETPFILRRPFLSTAGVNIDVGTGSVHFHINGKEEKFEFQPRTEQCSMVKIKYGPNPQNIQVVEVEPPKTDSLVKFMQNFLEKKTTMPRNRYRKTPVKASTPAKKLEQLAQRKPPSAPKPRKVWKEKPKTPAPSPPKTGGKSMN
uniref:Retrotransposon gag domain-containing protein n=1 Tax=Oryza sativa subsp. japonica TaxID=39947 RepID=Q10IJ0_ORYSJ|nr:hypothetical protein LOC_Os03g34102 [Oryza sativa Japonica Group]